MENHEVVESALELAHNGTQLCQEIVNSNNTVTQTHIEQKYLVDTEYIQYVDDENKVTFYDVATNISEQVEQELARLETQEITEPETTTTYDQMEKESLPPALRANFKTLMNHLSVQKAALNNMCPASCTSDTSFEEIYYNVTKGIKQLNSHNVKVVPKEAQNILKIVQNTLKVIAAGAIVASSVIMGE